MSIGDIMGLEERRRERAERDRLRDLRLQRQRYWQQRLISPLLFLLAGGLAGRLFATYWILPSLIVQAAAGGQALSWIQVANVATACVLSGAALAAFLFLGIRAWIDLLRSKPSVREREQAFLSLLNNKSSRP